MLRLRKGTVNANGEKVKKVTVDGREFFGEDATAALKNLPAEIIDKIQVFDRLSEQAQLTGFEDDNTAKGINIVTKANMRNGQFGRLYAGYGTDNRYSAGGNVSFFNGERRISLVGMTNNINQQNFSTEDLLGVTSSNNNRQGRGGARSGGGGNNRGSSSSGNFLVGQQTGISKTNALGINFADKWGDKLNVTGSYFFNNSNNNADQSTNRQYFLENDSIQFYNEKRISSSTNDNHRINMRSEYKMDSSDTLIITPNISFQKNNSVNHLTGVNTAAKGIISKTDNTNTSNNSGYNISNNILFRHAFPKRGRAFHLTSIQLLITGRAKHISTHLIPVIICRILYSSSATGRITDTSFREIFHILNRLVKKGSCNYFTVLHTLSVIPISNHFNSMALPESIVYLIPVFPINSTTGIQHRIVVSITG